jgi:hypothetical protein
MQEKEDREPWSSLGAISSQVVSAVDRNDDGPDRCDVKLVLGAIRWALKECEASEQNYQVEELIFFLRAIELALRCLEGGMRRNLESLEKEMQSLAYLLESMRVSAGTDKKIWGEETRSALRPPDQDGE